MPIDVRAALEQHHAAIACVAELEDSIQQVANRISETFAAGGKVFACGNGGSASDAQHFTSELTGRYKLDRPGYPAIALTTDTSALTAIGNDYGYDAVFSRQLESLGTRGDLLIGISTSGNSGNIIKAVDSAKQKDIYTVGLLGRDGGKLISMVDSHLNINVSQTARIQEAHILILHLLCEAFEPDVK